MLTQPDDEAESMRGPLYIPDTAKEKPTQGKVLAVEKAAPAMAGGGMGECTEMTQLSALYARFDAIAKGSENGNSSAAHGAILDRLAANRRRATTDGWTGLSLERDGGGGRLRLVGVPPSESYRTGVPDLVREL